MRIASYLDLEAVSTPFGPRLHVASTRTVDADSLDDDGGVTLDSQDVEQLREACDEFLAGRRV